jgi:hypothetical protein
MLYIILKILGYGEHSIYQIVQSNKESNEIQKTYGDEYIITQFTNQEYIDKYRKNNIIKINNQNYEIKII